MATAHTLEMFLGPGSNTYCPAAILLGGVKPSQGMGIARVRGRRGEWCGGEEGQCGKGGGGAHHRAVLMGLVLDGREDVERRRAGERAGVVLLDHDMLPWTRHHAWLPPGTHT